MKVWDQLIMKQIREKGRTKTVVCTNLKQTCTKCDVVLFDVQGNAGKNDIYKKRHEWVYKCFSYFYQWYLVDI